MNQNTGDVLVTADELDLEAKGEEMKPMCMSCGHNAGQIHSNKTVNPYPANVENMVSS